VYLGLYTWNWRTGFWDRLASKTGLEFVGWVLYPGEAVSRRVTDFWNRYVYLVGVRQENEDLRDETRRLNLEIIELRKEAAQARRLRDLLGFRSPESWTSEGATVIAHRMGPNAGLETVIVDKGSSDGFDVDTPVITPEGAVGRVFKVSPNFSDVLLLTDPNSRISVIGQQTRVNGILAGQGPGVLLQVLYVPINDSVEQGELLVTSGLGGVFPKGVPVARVVSIERSSISLFQTVLADPLVNFKDLEEVLLIRKQEPENGASEAESEPGPGPAAQTDDSGG